MTSIPSTRASVCGLALVVILAGTAGAFSPTSSADSHDPASFVSALPSPADDPLVGAGGRDAPCPNARLMMNAADYHCGYGWQYGGCEPPYYGAFAEGYEGTGVVCGARFLFTTLSGNFQNQTMDVYLWTNDGSNPGVVLGMTTDVYISPPAIHPNKSTHDVDIIDVAVDGGFFVGFWGNWPGQMAGWLSCEDLDGPGGLPRTNIRPGLGYPSGWQDPSMVWGPTQAMWIGAWIVDGAGACCTMGGNCRLATASECDQQSGSFQGPGIACDPDPCGVSATGDDVYDDAAWAGEQPRIEPIAAPVPFREEVAIRYVLEEPGTLTATVYTVGGRVVRTLEQPWRDSGEHSLVWDGRGHSGARVAAGSYLVHMRSGDRTWTVRVIAAP